MLILLYKLLFLFVKLCNFIFFKAKFKTANIALRLSPMGYNEKTGTKSSRITKAALTSADTPIYGGSHPQQVHNVELFLKSTVIHFL